MTTTYLPARGAYSGAAIDSARAPTAPATSRYCGAAALCAAIRAAAEVAPEYAPETEFPERYGATRYPFKVPAEYETSEPFYVGPASNVGRECILSDGPACYWPRVDSFPEAPGPFLAPRADVRAVFAYSTPDGARGTLTVANVRGALLALADKVHTNRAAFDGKTRRAARPGPVKGSAPHVAARAMIGDDPAGALAIAENVGAVFFGRGPADGRPFEYMSVQPVSAAGHEWMIGRAIRTGRFRVLHARAALAADPAGFSTYSAALDWLETSAADPAFCERVATALQDKPDYCQTEARAACLARGTADDAAGPMAADSGAPAAPVDTVAPVAPIDAPTADPAPRYSFDAHLIGTDSQRVDSIRFECAGPGLTSADIERAQHKLRELAGARGLRIVSSNFGDYAARAWCEPMPKTAPHLIRSAWNDAPAAPVNPGPAAPAAPAAPIDADAHRAPLNVALAALTLARLCATYAPDSTRAAAIVAAGRTGSPAARETIGRYLSRIAAGGLSLEKREALDALALIEPARAASGPGIWPVRAAHDPAALAAVHPDRARALAGLSGAPVGSLTAGPGAAMRPACGLLSEAEASAFDCAAAESRAMGTPCVAFPEPRPLTGQSDVAPLTVHSDESRATARPPDAPIDAPALIRARVTACDSALTAAGLAHYVRELAPLGVDAIEREARALVAAGKLGEFDYSAQGMPSAFFLPIAAKPAPAPRRAPPTLAQCHHATRRRTPPLRIPGTDPRARIPARFSPVYLLQA